MTDDIKLYNSTVVRRPARFRGSLNSAEYNDTQEEIVQDIVSLTNIVNSLNSRLTRSVLTLQNENSYLRRCVDALKNQQDYVEKIAGYNGTSISRLIDFSNTEGISFPNNLDDSRSAMLSSEFGELTLPPNAIENKFYVTSLLTNKVVPSNGLYVTVKGTFDKSDGEGLVNYERGGRVTPGDPTYAFNGINDLYWIRRVEFPIDSRVDQVEVEMTVVVPDGSSSAANTIEIVPFPNGSVDITELATASDLGNNFIRVSTFSPTNNLTASRYHFPATTVDQIRIRLRQRNWVEENGKKVFYYGLQELGLKLIDYDKNWTPGSAFGTNNSFIVEIPAPDGFIFNQISRVDTTPSIFLEDQSKRHVHIRLGTSSDFSINTVWDSDTNVPPQQSSSVLSAASSRLYAFVQMNYVSDSGGSLSPFPVGTTPFLKALALSFTLIEG